MDPNQLETDQPEATVSGNSLNDSPDSFQSPPPRPSGRRRAAFVAIVLTLFVGAWMWRQHNGSSLRPVAAAQLQHRWMEVTPAAGSGAAVMSLLTLPDGRVFSVASDGRMSLFNPDALTAGPLSQKTGAGSINSIAASGPFVFLGESEGLVRSAPTNGEPPVEYGRFSEGPALSLDVSPDHRMLVAGGMDGQTIVWDISTRQQILAFPTQSAVVLARFIDSNSVIIVSYLGIVERHAIPSGSLIGEPLELPLPSVASAQLSPDKHTLAIGSAQHNEMAGTLLIVDLTSQRVTTEMPNITGSVQALAFSLDGRKLALCDDVQLGFYDTASGKIRTKGLEYGHHCTSVAYTPDTKSVLVGEDNGRLYRYEP